MRFLDSLTGRTPANADEGVNVPIAVAPGAGPVTGAPAAAAGLSIGEQLALEAEIEPPAPKPSPKVAVVVAGAALAVTTGLTLMILPFVRQAAKMTTPPQFLSHRNAGRAPVTAGKGVLAALRASPAAPAAETDTAAAPAEEIPDDLAAARAFNVAEEQTLYGRDDQPKGEDGEPLEPVSPWLGFQALGIATAMVLGSAGLGVYGAAKYLGVSSMDEFAARMRENLEQAAPEFVGSVRREGEEPTPDAPELMDKWGHDIDDGKLREWVKGLGYGDESK